jgi:hypothetical protein
MKFDFKPVPVPKLARKRLPKDAKNVEAFKTRPRGEEPVGTVIGFGYGDEGSVGWAYIREGKLFGGCSSRQDAAEALAKS